MLYYMLHQDFSVSKSSSFMFPIFPAMSFASNPYTAYFLVGLCSALSITSFLSSSKSSRQKPRPTKSLVRHNIIALTADSAFAVNIMVILELLVFIFVLLGNKTSVDKPLLEYMSKKLNTR